jgi:hypothetical protein
MMLPLLMEAQIPALNRDIVKYVNTVTGKKVGRGECWDLAHDALTLVNAQWDHHYKFGKEIDPLKDSIYPGDIIHFDNVVLRYKRGNESVTENYPQHTAIVFEVLRAGEYKIAHQNNAFSGRKVGFSIFRLADKKSGKWQFYRPQPAE